MDKFIKENTEKKAILLGFKELKKRINTEMVNHPRNCKKSLIVSTTHAHLILEVLERNLDMGNDLDIDLNFVDGSKSKISIWGMPIYVTQEDNMIRIINSLGELCTDPWEAIGNSILVKELDDLIEKLPDHSKFRKVLPEEMK